MLNVSHVAVAPNTTCTNNLLNVGAETQAPGTGPGEHLGWHGVLANKILFSHGSRGSTPNSAARACYAPAASACCISIDAEQLHGCPGRRHQSQLRQKPPETFGLQFHPAPKRLCRQGNLQYKANISA